MKCNCGVRSCVDNVPIFSNMTKEELGEIIDISSHKNYKKGQMIYNAGEVSNNLYVVYEGQIKISRLTEDGKEQVIRVLGPGEFMGELSLFASMKMSDFALSLTASTICIINGGLLKERIKNIPSIAFKIMEELSKRLENVESLVENINLYTVEKRLANFLLKENDEFNEIELKTTKQNIASQIGMSQETLSRKLTSFQDKGYIKQIGHRKIIILNKKALEEVE